jgi:hypothetical protein
MAHRGPLTFRFREEALDAEAAHEHRALSATMVLPYNVRFHVPLPCGFRCDTPNSRLQRVEDGPTELPDYSGMNDTPLGARKANKLIFEDPRH